MLQAARCELRIVTLRHAKHHFAVYGGRRDLIIVGRSSQCVVVRCRKQGNVPYTLSRTELLLL
jgi:hypothetical protein